MLASRRGDSDLSHSWSFSKTEASPSPLGLSAIPAHPVSFPISPRSSSSPRMSNASFETPLSNASEWTGQYSFLPPAEPIFASQAYDQITSGSGDGSGDISNDKNGGSSTNNNNTSMASSASTTSSNGASTSIGALLGSNPQTQAHNQTSTPRPSTSTNGGDGSGSVKASSTSPLGLHHRRALDPLELRQSSQVQTQHSTSSQDHTGSSLRSPSTPASDHHSSQVQQLQHHHQHHQHQSQTQHQQHQQHQQHHYQHPHQHTHQHQQYQPQHQHHHGSDSHDISPMLSNPLSGSMSNPLSAVLQLPGIVTHFGGSGHTHSMSHMNSMRSDMGHGEEHPGIKGEDDDLMDSENMGDAGESDIPPQPQTAAERISQRRKMKRFRLTHQQTRFLMSEFAKQPHPDAAHRERLSREIPGLSPRQVQVWFQNRRAKIKRLAADDRERMIKMRAVPDDFDNIQALHSPYGAVHGLGTPMASPVDFNAAAAAAAAAASPYGDHMMRPLMVDVRRSENDDHMSPTGLSPAFGSIGFNPSGTMSSSDIMSPLSPTSSNDHHRYSNYSSQLSTAGSATSASNAGTVGPRSSIAYARPGTGTMDNVTSNGNSAGSGTSPTSGGNHNGNSASTGTGLHHHQQRHQIRLLQPLQLRETMSRSRSDQLQSPLRSSMSWKGDSLDYNSYHTGGSGSPQLSGRPQQSLYPSDSSYDNPYSGSTVRSPTPMAYQGFPSLGLQATSPSRSSRLRAASATLPLALDLSRRVPQSSSYMGSLNSLNSLGSLGSMSSLSPLSSLSSPLYGMSRALSAGYSSSYAMPLASAPLAPTSNFPQTQTQTESSRREDPFDDQSHGLSSLSGDAIASSSWKRKHSFT